MKNNRSYIIMALAAIMTAQSITAQLIKPNNKNATPKRRIVTQLKDSYKRFTKRLRCAVRNNCTPQERQQLRRDALWIIGTIGTLVGIYAITRLWPRKEIKKRYEEKLKEKDDLLQKYPTIKTDEKFLELINNATTQAGIGAYSDALSHLNEALGRAIALIPTHEDQYKDLQKKLDALTQAHPYLEIDSTFKAYRKNATDFFKGRTYTYAFQNLQSAHDRAQLLIQEEAKKPKLTDKERYEALLTKLPESITNEAASRFVIEAKEAAAEGSYNAAYRYLKKALEIIRKEGKKKEEIEVLELRDDIPGAREVFR